MGQPEPDPAADVELQGLLPLGGAVEAHRQARVLVLALEALGDVQAPVVGRTAGGLALLAPGAVVRRDGEHVDLGVAGAQPDGLPELHRGDVDLIHQAQAVRAVLGREVTEAFDDVTHVGDDDPVEPCPLEIGLQCGAGGVEALEQLGQCAEVIRFSSLDIGPADHHGRLGVAALDRLVFGLGHLGVQRRQIHGEALGGDGELVGGQPLGLIDTGAADPGTLLPLGDPGRADDGDLRRVIPEVRQDAVDVVRVEALGLRAGLDVAGLAVELGARGDLRGVIGLAGQFLSESHSDSPGDT